MRKLFIILVFILIYQSAFSQQRKGDMSKPFIFSQQFKHAIGPGVTFYEIRDSQEPIYQLCYNPTLSLTRAYSDFSVAVGTQLAGGYHVASTVHDTGFIYADLPLLVEVNFGHNASKDFYSDLGWFLGGGYTFNMINDTWQQGPVATIGVRAFVFGPSFTLRFSHFFPMKDADTPLNTISLLLNLGRYFEQVKLNNKVSRFQ